MKRSTIAAGLLLAIALPGIAHADPKTITLDHCAKVEQEAQKDRDRDRVTITVKCTGEALDPEVRKPVVNLSSTITLGPPYSRSCVDSSGATYSC